jgi:hypothetical protein
MDKVFLTQVKRTNGSIEKGCVVKDTLDGALQSYFAYLSAYGYGHDPNTDYVMVAILDSKGLQLEGRVWEKPEETEVENA